MENIFIKALESERKRIESMNGNWGTGTRNRLVAVLEENDIYIYN